MASYTLIKFPIDFGDGPIPKFFRGLVSLSNALLLPEGYGINSVLRQQPKGNAGLY